jgi:hypothetical protein
MQLAIELAWGQPYDHHRTTSETYTHTKEKVKLFGTI